LQKRILVLSGWDVLIVILRDIPVQIAITQAMCGMVFSQFIQLGDMAPVTQHVMNATPRHHLGGVPLAALLTPRAYVADGPVGLTTISD
jgi:hypothetical protein